MLQAADLSFSYSRHDRPVLSDVSLNVARGGVVGLLGPNGSGKTTLLRLLAGMLRPSHGRVMLDGQPIAEMTRQHIARRLAMVPQDTHTAFDYSVLDMVLMGRYPHLGAFTLESDRDIAIAREALDATGTRPFESRLFSTLSGGEKQRVVIAAALAQSAEVLLLDEPTTALDLGYQFEIAAVLRRLNQERGTTMIVSSHDLNLIAALCQHVVMLKDGHVIAQGATTDTLTPANIQRLYGVDADVRFHEQAGHLTVVPIGHAR